jgi:hypothetical protein
MLGAQAEPYYGMDKKYDNYGSNDNSYGNDNYGQDSSYDKKPYGNSYGQDYPSYKPDYKKDPYGKDRDHDKDSSSSVSIKKLKCNNINVNLNNIDATFGSPSPSDGGADGGATDEALAAAGGQPVAANSLMNGGNNGDRSFVDRENNFAFVCINNNNNSGGGNQTNGGNETVACEDCFEQNLNSTQLLQLQAALDLGIGITLPIIGPISIDSLAELCAIVEANPTLLSTILDQVLIGLDLSDAQSELLEACIEAALGIDVGPL